MRVKDSQKGFTLIEILVAMAVSGMLLSGLVIAIFQTFGITSRSSTQITALENIKNAAYRISNDVRMAATANLTGGDLVLFWTSWYTWNEDTQQYELNPVDYRCEYTLSGTNLERIYDPDTSVAGNEVTTTVGRYISDIQFSRQGEIILVTITASPEGRPETAEQKTYHMYLQPKENPVQ